MSTNNSDVAKRRRFLFIVSVIRLNCYKVYWYDMAMLWEFIKDNLTVYDDYLSDKVVKWKQTFYNSVATNDTLVDIHWEMKELGLINSVSDSSGKMMLTTTDKVVSYFTKEELEAAEIAAACCILIETLKRTR